MSITIHAFCARSKGSSRLERDLFHGFIRDDFTIGAGGYRSIAELRKRPVPYERSSEAFPFICHPSVEWVVREEIVNRLRDVRGVEFAPVRITRLVDAAHARTVKRFPGDLLRYVPGAKDSPLPIEAAPGYWLMRCGDERADAAPDGVPGYRIGFPELDEDATWSDLDAWSFAESWLTSRGIVRLTNGLAVTDESLWSFLAPFLPSEYFIVASREFPLLNFPKGTPIEDPNRFNLAMRSASDEEPEEPPIDPRRLAKYRRRLGAMAAPALRLVTSRRSTRSRIGGLPDLPFDFVWPTWDGEPLAFLCQLDLAEAAEAENLDFVPGAGLLLFFHDALQRAWGYEPEDRGSARVFYVPPGIQTARAVDPAGSSIVEQPAFIRFVPMDSLPPPERLDIEDEQADYGTPLYEEIKASFGKTPKHQFGGYPFVVQSDEMEFDCEMGRLGIDQERVDLETDPRMGAWLTSARRRRWRLLLQIDSDKSIGFRWADSGSLYFWIPEKEARAGRFDGAWAVLQSG